LTPNESTLTFPQLLCKISSKLNKNCDRIRARTDRQTETDRQTNRQTDRQTETDRQTNRQTDRQTETDRQTNRQEEFVRRYATYAIETGQIQMLTLLPCDLIESECIR